MLTPLYKIKMHVDDLDAPTTRAIFFHCHRPARRLTFAQVTSLAPEPIMKKYVPAALVLCLAPPLFAQNRASTSPPGAPPGVTTPDRGRGTQPSIPTGPLQAATQPGATGNRNAPTAANVDETPVVTKHTLTLDGKQLHYTATVQQMPIQNTSGETEAHMFYVAYTLDDADHAKRPVTFCFNGGPGSASFWVHMGAMGPRSPVLKDNGDMPPPPFTLRDNSETWLDKTDLVFIDAVGTGYSRAKTQEVARRLNGVSGDIQSFGEFVRMYITRNDRWNSPLFIAGESYGTFRAAGLAGNLIDQGIAVNGVTLISTILNYGASRGSLMHNLPYALYLPTFTADAFYHKKLPPDLQKDMKATLKEAEAFAMTEYLPGLDKGDTMSADERRALIEKLHRYTGLSTTYLDDSDMRVDVQHFTRELLRDQKLTIGRLDGRLTGPSPLNAGETAEFDPSGTLTRPPFQAAFMQYIRTELNYKTDMFYYVSGGILPWDYASGGGDNNFVDTTAALRNAFEKNPHLKVMVCCGYHDLATPYFAAQYTLNHTGLHPEMLKNVSWQFYDAGHMMYIDKPSHEKLKKDIAAFIDACTAH
jgi:carboxypeptidase C (cathepsin A)